MTIDINWLREEAEYDFYCEEIQGQVTGFKNLGTEWAVFLATYKDGSKVVLKTYRNQLGFHIREFPFWLTTTPKYDVNRLNQKLLRLVGNPLFDTMTHVYNSLYETILRNLDAYGVIRLLLGSHPAWGMEFLPFILHTPSMKQHLHELKNEQSSLGEIGNLTANNHLEAIEKVPLTNINIHPERIGENPLYIWGGAIMDGFFTDEELPQAVSFIEAHYGPLVQHQDMQMFLDQIFAIAHLLAAFTPDKKIDRLIKFCMSAGFLFHVVDTKGNIVV